MTRLLLPVLVVLGLTACNRREEPVPAEATEQPASPTPAASADAAAPQADPASCVTYDGAYATAPLMRVRGAADTQVRFHNRAEACPATGDCDWRRDGYVIGGDVVLVSAPVNGFRCVYAPTDGGDIAAGFLPAVELEPDADDEPATLDFLAGRWGHLKENFIAITKDGGRLTAKGNARYETGTEFGPNIGEFSGPLTLDGTTARYSDEVCTVTARRRGPFLIVSDNNGCGGNNVSFSGIYTRAGD